MQETVPNKKIMQNVPPTKNSRITDWSSPTLTDIKTVLGVEVNLGLHSKFDFTSYFSQAWVNKIPSFSSVYATDKFLLLFWHLCLVQGKVNWKKTTVAVCECIMSFKTGKFGLKLTFQVFMVASVKMTALCDIAPCSLVVVDVSEVHSAFIIRVILD